MNFDIHGIMTSVIRLTEVELTTGSIILESADRLGIVSGGRLLFLNGKKGNLT
jgi:hypothetical protein